MLRVDLILVGFIMVILLLGIILMIIGSLMYNSMNVATGLVCDEIRCVLNDNGTFGDCDLINCTGVL